eukprot:TRINITY_DN958_c0_g2_i1.p1 TRINITY_DN958_c0_g2~~TRINITY_DN958_c0_g2_i1.p1  ORF type:complete len:139 (+),score=62.55 TRINITY_DN958_c0_g2_i1:274-690(+)
MRIAKVEELIKEVEILSQNHEREVDRKDAIIQMLDRDLEEADEQHQMALRSHLVNVDALITLQRSRLLAMEQHFERDLGMIEEEFRAEFEDMKATHKRTSKAVSYTHLRAHETVLDLVCRLLLEKKKNHHYTTPYNIQ